ncbi:hypothetical protein GUJ93_ZPchr0002g24608 [Zizania palustris]|uniref:Uncharacterized protein n=1 Tax=Zizania palustris TaxID=103762 RepID=A0A8J5VCQ8_ZIZPA|nr:hypothetical protein GUJ93_ZPchr0002g24608 [Zizania palustris]
MFLVYASRRHQHSGVGVRVKLYSRVVLWRKVEPGAGFQPSGTGLGVGRDPSEAACWVLAFCSAKHVAVGGAL